MVILGNISLQLQKSKMPPHFEYKKCKNSALVKKIVMSLKHLMQLQQKFNRK